MFCSISCQIESSANPFIFNSGCVLWSNSLYSNLVSLNHYLIVFPLLLTKTDLVKNLFYFIIYILFTSYLIAIKIFTYSYIVLSRTILDLLLTFRWHVSSQTRDREHMHAYWLAFLICYTEFQTTFVCYWQGKMMREMHWRRNISKEIQAINCHRLKNQKLIIYAWSSI